MTIPIRKQIFYVKIGTLEDKLRYLFWMEVNLDWQTALASPLDESGRLLDLYSQGIAGITAAHGPHDDFIGSIRR